eukprot:CAMPEP_0198255876 /NCGR_PEP_ID=MMETSP1447-20131203/5914_1 /TAXON_ID=420782 /ORGANISM="Chaetoceros dichaeta, Strain CCMP1751" /LENGTH=465 /DNA_ID=CAMNT_0043942365 /DNA_START=163 /DNA_END=1560 /DNA_ORIENTATION=+
MSVKCQGKEIDDIVRRHSMYANDLKTTADTISSSSSNATNKTQADKNIHFDTAPIYKFALTGGPCGGKTTALERISSYLRERGFEVFTVPEAMTVLCSNGFSKEEYFKVDGMPYYVQHSIMDLQTSLEDSFERVLKASGKKGVILCDRGLMDGSAYMSPEGWDKLMEERGVSSAEIREGRYNAVFHLVTSAEGAEQFYSLENNAARNETAEQAREVDVLTRKAWLGHQNLMVFDNSTDFETKLRDIVAAVSKLVGLPTTMKNMTVKYLLRKNPDLAAFPEDVHYYIFDVEKVYLYNIDINSTSTSTDSNFIEEYSFIRKRSHISLQGKELGTTYGITTARTLHDGNNIEVKRIISSREYISAYHARDTSRHIVKQRRISFLYKTQSFNIHIYKEPIDNLCIVQAQAASVDDVDQCHNGESNGSTKREGNEPAVDFPPFLDLERRLENNKEDEEKFGSFNISLMND